MRTTPAPTTGTSWLDGACDAFVAGMPSQFERLTWSADRLRVHQHGQLQRLLTAAIEGSAFHRARLSGIDPKTVTLDDLATVPVMTKSDMMRSYDEVVTDPRLTREVVDRHLRGLSEDPVLLFDQFLPLVSGGSSGERGVFVYTRDTVVPYVSAVLRTGMATVASMIGWPPPMRIPIALVAAPTAIHATGATAHLLDSIATLTRAPVTLPFDEILSRVAAAQPMLLVGYPSMIAELADAQAAGRLDIAPIAITVTSEQLTAELATRITTGFGVAPSNSFGSSEGCHGIAAPGSEEFVFASDYVIMEFVDENDKAVPVGTTANHVLITNLFNPVQPLIRYRLDDRMTPLPAVDHHGHQRATLAGRNDTVVHIDGTLVHTLAIRTALLRHPTIREHQTVVGPQGLTIRVAADGSVDTDRAASDVASNLSASGAASAVEVVVVDAIQRDAHTGKVQHTVRM
jgi:phenylacetate-coenzyme A ligase PaaK-like adenylate-forming protein